LFLSLNGVVRIMVAVHILMPSDTRSSRFSTVREIEIYNMIEFQQSTEAYRSEYRSLIIRSSARS